MREAVQFLQDVGVLLGEAEPGATSDRGELVVAARATLELLRMAEPSSDFILTPAGISWGPRPLEFEGAAWLDRLREEGVAVLAPPNDEVGFGRWISGLAAQVGAETDARTLELVGVAAAGATDVDPLPPAQETDPPEPAVATPPQEETPVAIASDAEVSPAIPAEDLAMALAATDASSAASLQSFADRVRQLHEAAAQGYALSFPEASGLVTSLVGHLDRETLTAQSDVICTLDEYTTAHSLNTALLSMKLARHMEYEVQDIMQVGIAGLLHDIGKVRLGDLPSVSRQMLSGDERGVLQSHAAEGARLLLDSGESFAMAAIVAYEHHMPWAGEGGYPTRHFDRPAHAFSRLVSVCDVYDVLRGERSFRPALSGPAALKYMTLLSKQSLDPEMVTAFVELARGPLPRIEAQTTKAAAEPHEIGWLPETGYDPDCEPRPVRF